MTGNTTVHDKARAIFLAALMVVSVFGMSAAFAGSAAADVEANSLSATDITVGQDSTTQVVDVNATQDNASIAINVSEAVNAGATDVAFDPGASGSSGDDTIGTGNYYSSNNTVLVNTSDSTDGDTNVSLGLTLNTSSLDTSDYTYDVDDGSGNAETVTFQAVGATDVTAEAVDTSVNGNTANVTVSHTDNEDVTEIALYDAGGDEIAVFNSSDDDSGTTGLDSVQDNTGNTTFELNTTELANNDFELGTGTVYAASESADDTFSATVSETDYQVSGDIALDGLNVNSISGLVNEGPVRIAANDTEVTYELTLENTGDEVVEQNVSLISSDANSTIDFTNAPPTLTGDAADTDFTVVAFEENVSVAADATETVQLTVNTGDLPDANQNVNDYEIAGYTSGTPYSEATTPLKVGSNTEGSVTLQVVDDNSVRQEGINVELWLEGDYPQEDLVVRNQTTNANGEVTFTDLAVGSDNNNEIQYVARAGAATDEFESTSTTLALYETTQTSDSSSLTLTRVVDADRLSVDPGTTVDVGSSVDISTLVQTFDEEPTDELSPFAGGTVEITNISADGPAEPTGLSDGDTLTTDASGNAVFEGLTTDEDFEDLDRDTDVTIEFTASPAGNSPAEDVTATTTITFAAEPPSGSGVISGDVYEYAPDTELTASDNTEGVSVHAVTQSRLDANTRTVNNANDSAAVRVVDDATSEVLNVETDYLFTNGVSDDSDNTELVQNTSIIGTGFDATDTDTAGELNFSVHVLEAGDYTIQVSDNGSFDAPSEYSLDASNNLTYEATEDRYADVNADHTAQTDSDGEFRLTALYTDESAGVDYAVIAGDQNPTLGFANAQGYEFVNVQQPADSDPADVSLDVQQVDVDADTVNITNVGTLPSAADIGSGDIAEFDDVSDDTRQEIPRDGDTVDVINVETSVEGQDPIGGEVTVSVDNAAFDGEFLNETLGGTVVSHSADSITIDTSASSANFADNEAQVFLQTDTDGLGDDVNVTVNATMPNAVGEDSTDKQFVGVLDQDYQSGSITGVVSDDNDNAVNAKVFVSELSDEEADISIVFEADDVDDLDNFTATVYDDATPANGDAVENVSLTAEEMRNFEFQGFESDLGLAEGEEAFNLFAGRAADRSTLSPVPAVAADNGVSLALTGVATESGATGTSVSSLIEVNRTSTGSIVIDEAIGANFQVSDLNPENYTAAHDESFTVSATVENNGDFSAEKDVELRLDGDEVATESLQLAAGASDTVEFSVNASDLAAGEYTHSVWTEDSEATGTLTVEEEPTDASWYDAYVNDDGVVDTTGLNDAVSAYLGGDLSDERLNAAIQSYVSGSSVGK